MVPVRWSNLARAALAAATIAALVAWVAAPGRGTARGSAQAAIDEIAGACGSLDPFYVTARYPIMVAGEPEAPAVVAFRAADDGPARDETVLATHGQVGAVYGLAFDASRGHVYAASVHKRGVPFGPGGPGALYRIDLATGRVARWAELHAGTDRHDFRRGAIDVPAADWAGLTGLGDVDLDDRAETLFVANLEDARIYRLSVPDGAVQGSFAFAAAREPWAFTARPVGLAYRDGWLYHAVLDTSPIQMSGRVALHLYRSRGDGSQAAEIATGTFPVTAGTVSPIGPPEPLWVGDIEVLPDGRIAVGLRDGDADALLGSASWVGERMLLVRPGAGAGEPVVDADYFDVTVAGPAGLGALASAPGPGALLTMLQPARAAADAAPYPLVRALDPATGLGLRDIALSAPTLTPFYGYRETYVTGSGDLEALCPRDQALAPGAPATATAAAAVRNTATAQALGTATAIAGATRTAGVPTLTAAATLAAPTLTAAAATATARYTEQAPTRTALASQAAATAAAQATMAPATLTAAVPSQTAAATRLAPTLTAAATEAAGAATARATLEVPTLTAHPTAAAGTAAAWATAGARTATAVARQPSLAATPTRDDAALAATATEIALGLTAVAPTREAMATAAATAATVPAERAAEALRSYDRIAAACEGSNPYLAVTRFVPGVDWAMVPFGPGTLGLSEAVIGFHDSLTESAYDRTVLAREPAVGATYGLAYDWRRGHLYAGAYLKRLAGCGPGGPGAIYRLDLRRGSAVPWAAIEAGPDVHALQTGFDEPATAHVGKLGLGDIEIDESGRELFVVNLFDRWIYRLAVPGGDVLGFFPHGAAAEPWAADARPFGLAVRGGFLYHGVVDSREALSVGTAPGDAVVYRSRPDGGDMREVARVALGYARPVSGYAWARWEQGGAANMATASGAMLSDIAFAADGRMLLGLRNRLGDAALYTPGDGDLLPSVWVDETGVVLPFPEHYPDLVVHDESTWGSLAAVPGHDVIVSTFLDPWVPNSGGAVWFDNATGRMLGRETVYVNDGSSPTFAKTSGLGDIEVLCPPAETATPTATASPTPSPSRTPTARSTPSPSPTPRTYTLYLPVALRGACTPKAVFADVVLVIDVSTSMRRPTLDGRQKLEAVQAAARLFVERLSFLADAHGGRDQVAVVGFNNDAWIEQSLTSDDGALRRAIDRLPDGMKEGTRLDLALRWGRHALEDPARIATSTPVIVLLTDGMPNKVPPAEDGSMETTVLREADAAKEAGILLYAIGVGLPDGEAPADRINVALLSGIASRPDMAYHTFSGEELGRIYGQIAYAVACPPGNRWPVP